MRWESVPLETKWAYPKFTADVNLTKNDTDITTLGTLTMCIENDDEVLPVGIED
jgi:hypothetical protein